MIICDTSGLLAALSRRDPMHRAVVAAMEAEPGPFIVPPLCLAELDHLVLTRWGVDAELTVLTAIRHGYELAELTDADLAESLAIIERYEDHEIGLADASIVALAIRLGTRRVLTLDHRHFRVLRGPGGRPFQIVPGD